MNATELILQFAASEGGSFMKRDLLSRMEGTTFSPSYIDLALSRMVKSGALTKSGRGQYQITDGKKNFAPKLDSLSLELAGFFNKNLPFTRYCVYEGEWINPFMHHLAGNHLHYLEVEREAMDSVFERITTLGRTAYLRPDREFMYRYVDIHNSTAIIVKPLISESPLISVDSIPCPTMEKLIVDISKDPDFDYLQGSEFLHVLNNIKRIYRINEPRLLRYASRRSVREAIANALRETDHDID